jgi:hypothetical protein
MYRLELFELHTGNPTRMHLKAGNRIRVNAGTLWLTLEGQSDDVWLRTGEQWDAPQDVTVWMSGEPSARIDLLRGSPARSATPKRGSPSQVRQSAFIVAA